VSLVEHAAEVGARVDAEGSRVSHERMGHSGKSDRRIIRRRVHPGVVSDKMLRAMEICCSAGAIIWYQD
jgi:hypothetical protein